MVSAQDDQVAQPVQDVGDEPAGVVARRDHDVDDAEHVGRRPRRQGRDELVDQAGVGQAQGRDRIGIGQSLGTGASQELTQDGQAVADAARAGPGHDRQRRCLGRDPLRAADRAQVLGQGPGRDQPEAVVERPRPDRRDDLVRLGGREDEPEVRWGLLDQLEQGIGRLVGQLVGLVDDVDLEPAGGRGVDGLLAQVPGIVDAAVRGGIELDDVHGAGAVGRQLDAAAALPARLGAGAELAVQGSGQDARRRGLAAPARAGEQVGVVGPAGLQGARQRLGHVLLADHLGQRARPVRPVERQCHVAHPNGGRRQPVRGSTIPR